MNQGLEQVVAGGQPETELPAGTQQPDGQGSGATVEDVVSSIQEQSIEQVVAGTVGQQTNSQQVDYGAQIGEMSKQIAQLTELVAGTINSQKDTNSQNNDNTLDSAGHNATIEGNDNSFDVEELKSTVTSGVTGQIEQITQELNNMKIASVKQTHSLSDADYKFVSDVASQVGVDILNDPAGLQSIMNAIEKNNKVIIGKKRVENQQTSTEMQMQQTGNYLKTIAGGKL